MNRDNIKGQFSGKPFDSVALERFVETLEQAGFPAQAEWKKGKRECLPAEANTLTLKVDDTVVFSHGPRAGHVDTTALPAQHKACLLDALGQGGFVLEPNLNLAIGLVIGFCVLHIGLILLRLDQLNQAFATPSDRAQLMLLLQVTGFVTALLGVLTVMGRDHPAEDRLDYAVPGLLISIGFILTVPSALMLMPALLYRNKQRIYEAVTAVPTLPPPAPITETA